LRERPQRADLASVAGEEAASAEYRPVDAPYEAAQFPDGGLGAGAGAGQQRAGADMAEAFPKAVL
jgi:hypothetical protein